MATNFRVKIDEIGRIIFICRLGIPKRIEIAISISKGSVWMIWLHRIKIWRIGELRSSNSEFKRGKRCTPLVDQQFGYVRLAAPLLDLAGISIEFCGAINTEFCFSYSLRASLLCRAGYTLGSATHF